MDSSSGAIMDGAIMDSSSGTDDDVTSSIERHLNGWRDRWMGRTVLSGIVILVVGFTIGLLVCRSPTVFLRGNIPSTVSLSAQSTFGFGGPLNTESVGIGSPLNPLNAESVDVSDFEPRLCMEMPEERLDNGLGSLNEGTVVGTAGECRKNCQENHSCGQSVFSSADEGTCYLFERPAFSLRPWEGPVDPDSHFTSAICGTAEQIAAWFSTAKHIRQVKVCNAWLVAEQAAKEMLSNLTLDDKISLLHGDPGVESGFSGFLNPQNAGGGPKIMRLAMNDGPQGFNVYTDPARFGTSTQFPSMLGLAATFSTWAVRRYAAALAEEMRDKGANVILGPDVEVTRVPSTGRSFETLSGEDPYLGSELVAPYIQEMQGKGIISVVKHFLDNNQEIRRQSMNSEVDDRGQHEIYLPPFKAAIAAGAGGVMCSYNKVYGTYACENPKLLKELLRKDANFKGFVVSDWGATHNGTSSALNGLDMEMPGKDGVFLDLPNLVESGRVSEETIDEMATHVLSAMHTAGYFDDDSSQPRWQVSTEDVTTDEHREVALQTILDGAVLLKNEASTLPMVTSGKKIAFIGNWCKNTVFEQGSPFMGQGSGYVPTTKTVPIFQAVQELVRDAVSITWSGDASAGAGADVAVVCASAASREGWDRDSYIIPEAADLVKALRAQPGLKKVIMVGIAPGAVTTEWRYQVDAALLLFYPGEQAGAAIAKLLVGFASPGGRLPVTLPPDGFQVMGSSKGDAGNHMFSSDQYPGVQSPPHDKYKWGHHLTANFSEGTLVGYRWYANSGVQPSYPFGFGLTYTEFAYKVFTAKCARDKIVVSFKVHNVGTRDGHAVPQVYVSFPGLLPVKRQLRGFQKMWIHAGQSADATFVIDHEDVSFYDLVLGRWVSTFAEGQQVTLDVGTSVADLYWSRSLQCSGAASMGM